MEFEEKSQNLYSILLCSVWLSLTHCCQALQLVNDNFNIMMDILQMVSSQQVN